MFRGFKNSRLGKYYSAVLDKYGKITPYVTAIAAFMLIFTAEYIHIGEMLKASAGAFAVTIALACVCVVALIYCFISKFSSKNISIADFILFVASLTAVFVLIQLFILPSMLWRNIVYICGLVVLAALIIGRISMLKLPEARILPKVAKNATVKSYFAEFLRKYNIVLMLTLAVGVFAFIHTFAPYFSDNQLFASVFGVDFEGNSAWGTVMIVSMVLLALVVLLNLPKRFKSKRMDQTDAAIFTLLVAALIYTASVAIEYSVGKLVLWLIALVALAVIEVFLILNTYVEKTERPEVQNAGGFANYYKILAKKYNLILGAAIALVLFGFAYSFLVSGFIGGVISSESALGLNRTAYLIVALILIVGVYASLIFAGIDRRVGAGDFIGYVLTVFAILCIIPVAQFFSINKVIVLAVMLVLAAGYNVFRGLRACDTEVVEAEVYNPAVIFGKANMTALFKAVKKFLGGGPKDAHYISNKESRRIAKENMRIIKEYEKEKRRKNVPEEEYVTKMRDENNIVEFDNLHTYFFSDSGVVKAVNGVSFDIPQGSTVGVVGESGCGKSVTSLSLMQLVQAPKGQVIHGSEIRFRSTVYKEDEHGKHIPIYKVMRDEDGNPIMKEDGTPEYETAVKMHKGKPVLGKDGKPVMEYVQETDSEGIPLFETEEKVYNVAKMPTEVMRKIRGREITMIFQEPMTSLNPIFTIGNQLDEVVLLHTPGATKESAKARTYEMLKLVGIIPENVYKRYPHELSGGMRQRVMIAMALLCHPKLIIADEPTTALDVTIQAQILDLLREVKKQINGSIMLITHDLGVIAEMADFVVVMYAGRVIEMGTAAEIFNDPRHPYTMGLQKSKPAVNKKVDRLYSIPGSVPNPINMPNYCYFRDRCDKRCDKCNGDYPEMIQISPTHKVSCHLYEKEDLSNGK